MSHWSVGLFCLLVYFSMRSLTGQWYSVRFIGLFGLSVYFSTVYFSMRSGCLFKISQVSDYIVNPIRKILSVNKCLNTRADTYTYTEI